MAQCDSRVVSPSDAVRRDGPDCIPEMATRRRKTTDRGGTHALSVKRIRKRGRLKRVATKPEIKHVYGHKNQWSEKRLRHIGQKKRRLMIRNHNQLIESDTFSQRKDASHASTQRASRASSHGPVSQYPCASSGETRRNCRLTGIPERDCALASHDRSGLFGRTMGKTIAVWPTGPASP